jgi:CubicO group peptidase (beta-lactamase class C family)
MVTSWFDPSWWVAIRKNKESFGHNGWGGSLGFADPILGIGVAYTTNKINPTMASDQRIINLLKKFYEII